MRKTVVILMIITIFSQAFGFIREIVLSYFYGTSSTSDAYIIALTIPVVIFSFIGEGIATGYIPMYSKIESNFGEEEGNRYTNNLVNILFVICTVFIILGLIFTNQIVSIFASGFKGETLILAIRFTKISLFGMYFTGVIYIFNGFLQIKGNYYITALIGFPMNLFIILSIYVSKNTDILILIIGSVVASASQVLLVIPSLHKKGYRYKFILDIKDEHIKIMAYIAWPIIIGVFANQINLLVDRTMASKLAVGGISALNYASRLNGFVQGLVVSSISTVLYPIISKMAAEKNIVGLKKSLVDAICGVNLMVIPATIGSIVFAEPIVRVLFGRGAFGTKAISMTSDALFFYSIGMVGFGLRVVIARVFYSMQDTKTPMINGCIAMTMNIVLTLILSKLIGIGGIALATSISAIFCTGLLFISLRIKIGRFGMKNITITFMKILWASLLMGVIAKLTYNNCLNNINASLSLIISMVIGALVYVMVIYFMKIEGVDVILNTIKRKIKKSLN